MTDWNRIWRVVVPVVLIVVVLTTTMGMVCHWHHDRYAADQCTLCHLVIAPALANTEACSLTLPPAEFAAQAESFVSGCTTRQIPSRAPPA
jgi:hypothetical protein